MRRSSNAIFKNIMILGAAMSLSACNGMFEGIYDDPIEAEMEIKESSFSQINATEYTNWVYINPVNMLLYGECPVSRDL